jgi:hypothetical protein
MSRDPQPRTDPRRKAALVSALVLGATVVLIYLTVMAKMFLV